MCALVTNVMGVRKTVEFLGILSFGVISYYWPKHESTVDENKTLALPQSDFVTGRANMHPGTMSV